MLGKDVGKILDIAGLEDREFVRPWINGGGKTRTLVLMVPHGVGQSKDAQDEEVDGEQQVDVLLGEHLWDGARSV